MSMNDVVFEIDKGYCASCGHPYVWSHSTATGYDFISEDCKCGRHLESLEQEPEYRSNYEDLTAEAIIPPVR